jgi:hypothetical protein
MMNNITFRAAAAALAVASGLLLSACGGGSDDVVVTPPAAPTAVPQSVTTSVASLLSYALESLGFTSETTEPAAMVDGALATDDTIEPSAI